MEGERRVSEKSHLNWIYADIVKFEMSSKRKSLALHDCYKHKFGVVGKRKHSRIRFSMFPTGEIGFGCHMTLVLKIIDFCGNKI